MSLSCVILAAFFLLLCVNVGKQIAISNTIPRRDINGNLMDIHDGTIIRFDDSGLYYWYGMGYGDCIEPEYWDCSPAVIGLPESMCGFQPNHTVNIYSSRNLQNWTYVGDALPFNMRPYGIYFRPKVIYNDITYTYVLWINFVSYKDNNKHEVNYKNTSLMVATSKTPDGPFTIQTFKVNLLYSLSPGDFVLFIDYGRINNTAYIAYDAFNNDHKIIVEQLTDNYLDSISTINSGEISDRYHEAPAMFKRNNWYYLLTGHCCCFCEEGSDAKVYASNISALGPYIETNMNINEIYDTNNIYRNIIHAQQNYIASIVSSNGKIQFIWTGDRWKSSPDKTKGHDFQYWQLLLFNDSTQPPEIQKLKWQDTIYVDIP